MESSAWTLLLPLSTIILFFFTSIYYMRFSSTSSKRHQKGRWPPSTPYAVPLLGDSLWLRKSLLELGPRLRRLRRELGIPVVTVKFWIFPVVFVTDRALIHEALIRKGSVFSDRPPARGAAVIISSNEHIISHGSGAVWRALRRNLLSTVFHPTRLRAFDGERNWVLESLLAGLKEEVAANGSGVVVVFAEWFRRAIFQLLLVICFGERPDETTVEEMSRVQRDLVSIEDKLTVFEVLPTTGKILFWRRWREFLEIWNRQRAIMIPLITAARNSRHRDRQQPRLPSYVDSLLDFELEEEGSGARKLTDDEIVSLCSEFFEAGVDTTDTTTEWAMANLVKHPHIQCRLAEEIAAAGEQASRHPEAKKPETVDNAGEEADHRKMPYLKAVIHETLRRHPPAPFLLPHMVAQDATLGEGKWAVPKGATVFFAAAEMGMDSAVWEDPGQFRPERFLEGGEGVGVDLNGSRGIKMIPFGAGRRICPGMGLAMLNLECFIAGLIRDFEWRPEAEGGEVDLSEKHEFTVKMKNPLRTRIYLRSAVPVKP